MVDNKDLLNQFRQVVREENEPLKERLDRQDKKLDEQGRDIRSVKQDVSTLQKVPSYSPDLSPIEPGWAKVKSYLRRVVARTVEALEQALAPALDSITAQDVAAFFRHCGYACPN
jgi:transposase